MTFLLKEYGNDVLVYTDVNDLYDIKDQIRDIVYSAHLKQSNLLVKDNPPTFWVSSEGLCW